MERGLIRSKETRAVFQVMQQVNWVHLDKLEHLWATVKEGGYTRLDSSQTFPIVHVFGKILSTKDITNNRITHMVLN